MVFSNIEKLRRLHICSIANNIQTLQNNNVDSQFAIPIDIIHVEYNLTISIYREAFGVTK